MLIQKKNVAGRKYRRLLTLASLCGCVNSGVLNQKGMEQSGAIDDQQETLHRLGLVGQDPAYLIQQPINTKRSVRPWIAEVKLWKDGEDLTPAYVYDGEVTGEQVYTVVADHLALSRASKGFIGDVERGYERATGDSFLSGITFKVRRVISPRGIGIDKASCPWTLFGNFGELFALESQPLDSAQPQLVKLRIRNRTLNQAQAQQIKAGLCTRLTRLDNAPLKPRTLYDMATELPGALGALRVEVIERLPFRLPKTKS